METSSMLDRLQNAFLEKRVGAVTKLAICMVSGSVSIGKEQMKKSNQVTNIARFYVDVHKQVKRKTTNSLPRSAH